MIRILHVGPDPQSVGGMAHVMGLIRAANLEAAINLLTIATTGAANPKEPWTRKALRHLYYRLRLVCTVIGNKVDGIHFHTCSGMSFWQTICDAGLVNIVAPGRRAIILHLHGGRFERFFLKQGRMGQALIRRALKRADAVIVLSEGWQRRLREIVPGVRSYVLENAVVESREEHHSSSTQLPATLCHVVTLTQFDEAKGVVDFLQSVMKLPRRDRVRVTLAGPPGDLGDAASLNARIQRMGLASFVTAIEAVRAHEKERLLRQADILVMPSRAEGMPIVILEAMARLIPVVTTRVGAVPEMIEDGCTGLLVESGDDTAMAAAMTRLITDPPFRRKLAVAARDVFAQRFTIACFQRGLAAIYTSLFGEGGTMLDGSFVGKLDRRDSSTAVHDSSPGVIPV